MPIHPILGYVQKLEDFHNIFQAMQANQKRNAILEDLKTKAILGKKELAAFPEKERLANLLTMGETAQAMAAAKEAAARTAKTTVETTAIPIESKLTEAQAQQIKAETSLTPYRKEGLQATTGKTVAETANLPLEGDLTKAKTLETLKELTSEPTRAPTIEEEVMETVYGKEMENAIAEGKIANRDIADLNILENAIGKLPKKYMGPHAGHFATARSILASDEIKNALSTTKSTGVELLIELLKKVKTGALSEAEREYFTQGIPNLMQTKGSALEFIARLKAAEQRNLTHLDFMRGLKAKGYDVADIESKWNDYVKNNSLIGEDAKLHTENIDKWEEYVASTPKKGASVGATTASKGGGKGLGGYKGTGASIEQWQAAAKKSEKSIEDLIANYKKVKGIK